MLRSAVTLVVAAIAATGCSTAPATEVPSASPTVGADLDELHDQVAAVARTQAVADARLADALEAVRRVVELTSALRSPEQVDAAVDRWPAVDAAFTSIAPDGLREGQLDLAARIDDARATLRSVRDDLGAEWEQRYLDAEDRVLVELRRYAETADRLAQTLQRVWPLYAELHERAGDFVERRWFYRTPQEAADAFELEVQPLLDDLAATQSAIARARLEREEAAAAVNAATRAAAEVWEERDAAPASPR